MYRFKRLARILLALALTILGIVVSTPVAQADSALTLRSSEEDLHPHHDRRTDSAPGIAGAFLLPQVSQHYPVSC